MASSISLISVVVDCPDARALADFYAEILGGNVTEPLVGWASLELARGNRLDFQTVPAYRAPAWPGLPPTTQMHLDLEVDDLDRAESRVLAAGARVCAHQPHVDQRIYLDPAGHPFCMAARS